jgi:hypothetical protein
MRFDQRQQIEERLRALIFEQLVLCDIPAVLHGIILLARI